jgi:hypothetical protein
LNLSPKNWVSAWIACLFACFSHGNTLTPIPEPVPSAVLHGVIPIEIELGDPELRSLRDHPRRYVAAGLTIAGKKFPQIGIHLKGSTGSFEPIDKKPGLTVNLSRFTQGASIDGLEKFHLNNSVEDPSYLNEWLGGVLFRKAGIPTPSVWHARVRLNGRNLGLYVLKEAYSRSFIDRGFGSNSGPLLEPAPRQDVGGRFKVAVTSETFSGTDPLKTLAAALREPDRNRRRERLDLALDRERFARFMAVEILVGHRDGYTLARNNYRVYLQPPLNRAVFLPHGMDQLFQQPEASWKPTMAGDVSRSWMEFPENVTLFESEVRSLTLSLLDPGVVSALLDDKFNELKRSLSVTESLTLSTELKNLKARVRNRQASLLEQLARPSKALIQFEGTRTTLSEWKTADSDVGIVTLSSRSPAKNAAIELSIQKPGSVSARSTLLVNPGRYRLRARVWVKNIRPLPFGKHQGATLRISGTNYRSKELLETSGPKPLEVVFEVVGDVAQEIQCLCELRGSAGTAWFERDSLILEQLRRE